MRSIKKEIKKIKGKTVFLRADFNVPIERGEIRDEKKIVSCLPTIRFLLRYKCKLIIATHLGRPRGRVVKKYSTKPIAKRLAKILGQKKVLFTSEIIGSKAEKQAQKLKQGQVLFLENLRFKKGEEKNKKGFAKKLARLAQVYVNDSFSVDHRKHASLNRIRKYLPSFYGLLVEREMENLDKVKRPKKPLVVVIGGKKIKTKINLIDELLPKAKNILIGGALANNFFKSRGAEIGQSLIDKESIKIAKKLKDKKIILPVDVVVSKKINGGNPKVKRIDQVDKKDIILDIGPETIKLYAKIIKSARTIIWNGPMGLFEEARFKHGTIILARVIATRSDEKAFTVVGGGETIKALRTTKMEDYINWVSTGGGAMLTYLGGEKMPGLF